MYALLFLITADVPRTAAFRSHPSFPPPSPPRASPTSVPDSPPALAPSPQNLPTSHVACRTCGGGTGGGRARKAASAASSASVGHAARACTARAGVSGGPPRPRETTSASEGRPYLGVSEITRGEEQRHRTNQQTSHEKVRNTNTASAAHPERQLGSTIVQGRAGWDTKTTDFLVHPKPTQLDPT